VVLYKEISLLEKAGSNPAIPIRAETRNKLVRLKRKSGKGNNQFYNQNVSTNKENPHREELEADVAKK